MAARAKVLLYAASPSNNPRPGDTEKFTDLVDRNGRNLIAQEYNEEKWAKAADAFLRTLSDGKHRDDGRHADDDAQHGEECAQLVVVQMCIRDRSGYIPGRN